MKNENNGKVTYIAGPMTGIPSYNFPAFFAAERRLGELGWNTVNPARHDIDRGYVELNGAGNYVTTQSFDLPTSLLWDLGMVARCDAIYLLNGWKDSRGAKAEYALAVALNKVVFHEEAQLPRVIGLGGLLRSGKDTVADHLVEKHGFVKLGMSDPMREIGSTQNPWILLDKPLQVGPVQYPTGSTVRLELILAAVGYNEAKTYREVRDYFQNLGTQVGRNIFGEETWTDIAVRRIQAAVAEGHSVVITGVRFPNEVSMFERVTGAEVTTLWVNRPSLEQSNDAQSHHASETSVSAADFDKVIENDGTLEDLYTTTDKTLNI